MTLIEQVQARVNERMAFQRFEDQRHLPTLEFVEMGSYGTPSYIKYFVQWADGVSDWRKRTAFVNGRKKNGSVL